MITYDVYSFLDLPCIHVLSVCFCVCVSANVKRTSRRMNCCQSTILPFAFGVWVESTFGEIDMHVKGTILLHLLKNTQDHTGRSITVTDIEGTQEVLTATCCMTFELSYSLLLWM